MLIAILLNVLLQTSIQLNDLEKVETASKYSSYASYNPISNQLLYFGISTDSVNQIVGSQIAVKSMSNGNEVIIDKDVGYPGIGWVDSTSVLIYKTFPETAKSFFDPNYKKALYMYNVNTGESILIEDIPLDSTKSKISVAENAILYKTGYDFDQSVKMYKYDMLSRKREEIVELRGMNVDDHDFILHSSTGVVYYSLFENDRHKLQLLKDGAIRDIYTSNYGISSLCFDSSKSKLFFLSSDGTEYEYQQVLRSYDLETGEIKTHYTFEEGVSCLRVSPYQKNSMLLSLELPSGSPSTHTFEGENLEVSLGIDPTRYLYKLPIN